MYGSRYMQRAGLNDRGSWKICCGNHHVICQNADFCIINVLSNSLDDVLVGLCRSFQSDIKPRSSSSSISSLHTVGLGSIGYPKGSRGMVHQKGSSELESTNFYWRTEGPTYSWLAWSGEESAFIWREMRCSSNGYRKLSRCSFE